MRNQQEHLLETAVNSDDSSGGGKKRKREVKNLSTRKKIKTHKNNDSDLDEYLDNKIQEQYRDMVDNALKEALYLHHAANEIGRIINSNYKEEDLKSLAKVIINVIEVMKEYCQNKTVFCIKSALDNEQSINDLLHSSFINISSELEIDNKELNGLMTLIGETCPELVL